MIDRKPLSLDDFSAWLTSASDLLRHELHEGVVFSFASGTVAHAQLITRLASLISAAVASRCEIFIGSLSLQIANSATSVIPDIMVTCEPLRNDATFAVAPNIVIEVISPSSVVNDLVRKRRIYEAIVSIETYIIVDSRAMWVQVYDRSADGRFGDDREGLLLTSDSVLSIAPLGTSIGLGDLYGDLLG